MNTLAMAFGVFAAVAAGSVSMAAEVEHDVRPAMAEASGVAKQRRASLGARRSFDASILKTIGLERFYEVGDKWRVEVRHVNHGSTRMSDASDSLRDTFLDPIYYDFEVKALEDGGKHARVHVTPVSAKGEALDQRVRSAAIVIGRDMRLMKKEYVYSDLDHAVVADFDGGAGRPIGFDAFPLELPDFTNVRKMSSAAGGSRPFLTRPIDPTRAIQFETHDLLARSVKVTWAQGDLWPTYIETHAGHISLVSQSKTASAPHGLIEMPMSAPNASPGSSGDAAASSATRIGYWDEWNFAELYKRYRKAVADPVPWAGYWWPYNENGIASRDNSSKVSPADKLDAVFGSTNWVAGWEWSQHGFGVSAADWWGHCNGWATAAIMEREPTKARDAGGTSFSVADRKAILSEYWLESGSDFIGTRVWNAGDTSSAAFWDVVPGQMHLLLTNLMGRQKRSMIIDRYTGVEVWNQPLVAYEIAPVKQEDYLGPDPEYPNIHRLNVTATIWWADDDVEPEDVTEKFKWKDGEHFAHRKLKYELWLDAPVVFDLKGNIVSSGDILVTQNGAGGRWKNGGTYETIVDTHPDFIWIPVSYAYSTGYKNPRINDEWVHRNLTD